MHPNQITGIGAQDDFLATGTYKGKGASGPDGACANDYDGLWSVYVDGTVSGTYFCTTILTDAYGALANPSFTIVNEICPSAGATRWDIYWGGALRHCRSIPGSAGSLVGLGLETCCTITTDYNIDMRATNLQRLQTNASWLSLNTTLVLRRPGVFDHSQ